MQFFFYCYTEANGLIQECPGVPQFLVIFTLGKPKIFCSPMTRDRPNAASGGGILSCQSGL